MVQKPTFAEQTSAIDDAGGPLGIRLVTQAKDTRQIAVQSKGPSLVVPIHSGRVEVATGAERHAVDRATWLLLPAGSRATISAKSPTVSTVILTIHQDLLDVVVGLYEGEIQPKTFTRILGETQLLPRTNWVNELCHRYVFERAVCKKRDNVATKFLETEIVKELYFLCHERFATGDDRRSLVEVESPIVERALAAIESDLFEADIAKRLPQTCGASASTLLRAFKREMGLGPLAYIRKRRLDESMLLLKTKRHSVSEIAHLVGYKNFGAFSQAFRTHFGIRPSDVKSTT